MDALYAFMRVTDDLADEPGDNQAKRRALTVWRERLDCALEGRYSHPLHPALHDTVRRYGIPPRYLHEVIDGVTTDLQPVRFATFDDLYPYCYRVASAVGLACIHIWGFTDEKAREYAEAAGIAFQLTNILRDLGEDLANGRVYLPQDDLVRFDCPPETWRQRGVNFRRMMIFQAERARSYYRKAEALAPLLTPSGRAVFQVMTRIYRGLLEEIERRDYDVFTKRLGLSRWRKLRALLLAFPVRWGWL
jgi:phytoene synthase